jgi:hypothetical protein
MVRELPACAVHLAFFLWSRQYWSMGRRLELGWKWVETHLWLLLFPLAWPALRPFCAEGLTRSFDAGLHMLRIGALDRYVREGILFPRWAPDLLLGFGYPLFNFYAPASYYFTELLLLLGLDVYHAFVAALAFFVVAAGIGMYFLALDVFGSSGKLPALAAATAYLYGPYLLTNVYIRGALAEAAAQALLPWILLFGRRLFYAAQAGRAYLPFALTLGLLAVTHNITLLFLPPLLLGYLFLHWRLSGRSQPALLWAVAGGVTAMGISAFFWAPLIAERKFLADTGFDIARSVWLPDAAWRWGNFLDGGLTYTHTFERPVRLGLVQAALALAGFAFARRRDAEWIFFAGVAGLAAAMMGAWALPLWQNVELLTMAQFPWRLLSILSLPLALFMGGIVLGMRDGIYRGLAAVAVVAVIVFSQQPRLAWMDVFAPETVNVSAAVFAQTEVEKGILGGGEGNSSIQEFRPRWADRTLRLEDAGGVAPSELNVAVRSGNCLGASLVIEAEQAETLRFTNFYFPGWRAVLDGSVPLEPYPSTNLGLLTVDIPAGVHELTVEWAGTRIQRMAALVSLAAMAAAVYLGWRKGSRVLAAGAGLALCAGVFGMVVGPAQQPVQQPTESIDAGSLTLAGYRVSGPGDGQLTVHPYWYVRDRLPDGLRFRWTLVDAGGAVAAETVAIPYYNSYGVENWAQATLVDDAVLLRLPAGTAGGEYRLVAVVEEGEDGQALAQGTLGEIRLPGIPGDPVTAISEVDARFGESARLAGYDVLSPRRVQSVGQNTPVLRAGDYLRLRLHWQGTAPAASNYHAFVHMVDRLGRPLVQEDQLPGPLFQPPRLWDRFTLWPDAYLLRLPESSVSGLYWPAVGMYEFATQKRLPVYAGDAEAAADEVRLPPIKIIGAQTGKPAHRSDYRLGDFAAFTGYDLEPSAGEVAAGSMLTVTLHFESRKATEQDLVRFVQVVGAQGVIAQQDAPPQDGANPTWAWMPGERVRDAVMLEIGGDVASGEYQVFVGMYDLADGGRRAPVYDGKGERAAEDWIPLGVLTIRSAEQ